MRTTSLVTKEHQTTLPEAVVEALQLTPSSILTYEIEADGRVLLSSKTTTFEALAATFPARVPHAPVSVEKINAAAKAGAVRRFRKTEK